MERTRTEKEIKKTENLETISEETGVNLSIEFTEENYLVEVPVIGSLKIPLSLKNKLEEKELESIILHEIAHVKFKHLLQDFLFFLGLFLPYSLFGFFFLEITWNNLWFWTYQISGALGFLILIARIHRTLELEADKYALEKTNLESVTYAMDKYNDWKNKADNIKLSTFGYLLNSPIGKILRPPINWLVNFSHPKIKERKNYLKNLPET